jgi:hypothetical protein
MRGRVSATWLIQPFLTGQPLSAYSLGLTHTLFFKKWTVASLSTVLVMEGVDTICIIIIFVLPPVEGSEVQHILDPCGTEHLTLFSQHKKYSAWF